MVCITAVILVRLSWSKLLSPEFHTIFPVSRKKHRRCQKRRSPVLWAIFNPIKISSTRKHGMRIKINQKINCCNMNFCNGTIKPRNYWRKNMETLSRITLNPDVMCVFFNLAKLLFIVSATAPINKRQLSINNLPTTLTFEASNCYVARFRYVPPKTSLFSDENLKSIIQRVMVTP